MLKLRSRKTGFKKSLSPIETLPEQMTNLLFSACSLMISNMEEYLCQKMVRKIKTKLFYWYEKIDKIENDQDISYVSLDFTVVTLWKPCCSNSVRNIVVFESYILPGCNGSPGLMSSSPVDRMHIGTSDRILESAIAPTLANRDFSGTRSGNSVCPLNKYSPFTRSHPIGLFSI